MEPLSTFVDYFLKPLVATMPTYLKDTKDVLLLLPTIEFDIERDYLVSFDVESLYTSIPQDETLAQVRLLLEKSEWQSITPIHFVMTLARLAMKENVFKFEDDLFLQVSGTSMGSVYAPSLANLYVHAFEEEHIFNVNNLFQTSIRVWKRYIDDIFVVWRGSEESIQQFLLWLNSRNPFLKFTVEFNKSHLAFLDLLITSTPSGLSSELYRKPM